MSQALPKKNFHPGSLRRPRTARTVLLRMAADEERAERIRTLKAEHPGLTWRYIAEQVGVSERAAVDWQKTGGINYENAKKLAEVFTADADWLWRGDRPEVPDPFASPVRDDQTESGLLELREHVSTLNEKLDTIVSYLARQDDLLKKIEKLAAGLPTDQLLEDVRQEIARLEERAAGDEEEAPAASKQAGTARRRGATAS